MQRLLALDNMRGQKWAQATVICLLFLSLFVLQSVAVRTIYTQHFPGGNDFYPRWAGASALLLEGRDPYSPGVTEEIQITLIGPDAEPQNSFSFAYPLFVVFTFWPLVYLPYDWVQAIWMVTLQWIAIATTAVLAKWRKWHLTPGHWLLLVLGALLFYPTARSIMLGQFTLHVTLLLATALWALDREQDFVAGILLSMTGIKPQMVLLPVLWISIWALGSRRWRFLFGFGAGAAGLMIASLAIFPRWPLSFIEDIQRYSQTAGGRNALDVLVEAVFPIGSRVLRYGFATVLVALMLNAWRRGFRSGSKAFLLALWWAMIVNLLVPFQTGTTNQAMLLLPLFAWLHEAVALRRQRWSLLPTVLGLVGLWVLFLGTIEGNLENSILFLPLPLFCLGVLLLLEFRNTRNRWRTPRPLD